MQQTINYSLSQKAFIISFGRIINRVSALFAIIYLSHHLSKGDYASYRQVWMLFNTLIPILSLGIPTSVNYFFPLLKKEDRKSFIFQTYFSLSVLGFVFTLLFFFGANSFSIIFNNPQIEELMKYFCIIPFLFLPTLFYQNLFVCLDNPILATKVSLFFSFFSFISIVVPLKISGSIDIMIYWLTIFYFIQFLLISSLYYKIFQESSWRFNKNLLLKQLKYAIPVGITFAIGIININIDNIFIASSNLFDKEAFAEYVNGAMELPFITIITGSIMAVLMPEFVKRYSNRKYQDVIRLWHSSITKVATIFFPMMCFLFIFSNELITIVFSDKYLESVPIFRIYLLQIPCKITIFGIILLSMNQSKFVLKSILACLILNIFLNYILIKEIGITGPAIATIISLYFVSFLQLNQISIKFDSKLSQIFPWVYLIKLIIISIVSGLIVFQIDFKFLNLSNNDLFNNILIVSIGLCCYSGIFLFTGLITKIFNKNNILNFK